MRIRSLMFSSMVLAVSFAAVLPAQAAEPARKLRGNADVSLQGLPKEKEGKFPIVIPAYEGIDQILVLTHRWVVVGVSSHGKRPP